MFPPPAITPTSGGTTSGDTFNLSRVERKPAGNPGFALPGATGFNVLFFLFGDYHSTKATLQMQI